MNAPATPVNAPPPAAAAAAPAAPGRFQAWLPLIVTVLAMPVLAYVTTQYVLLPKMKQSLAGPAAALVAAPASTSETPAPAHGHPAAGPASSVGLNKILVNVAGTMGSRYLLTSLTLAGSKADFANRVEAQKPQLLDLAAGVLSSKTIEDLEKPGVRNQVRGELISVFNGALGDGTITDVYLTEFAVQ